MTQIIKPDHKTPEVADILHLHLNDYKAEYPLWPEHHKITTNLLDCRTARLGGHIERCDNCGVVRITYHSCRNRHCPKCQHMPRERWLEKRKDEILPTSYFHVVFTPVRSLVPSPTHQIEILYPYSSIVPDRREAASHISVLSIIPYLSSFKKSPLKT